MPKVLSFRASNGEAIIIATGKEAEAFGGKEFAKVTEQMLLAERTKINARAFVGGVIANLPSNPQNTCTGIECWLQRTLDSIYSAPQPPCTSNPYDDR